MKRVFLPITIMDDIYKMYIIKWYIPYQEINPKLFQYDMDMRSGGIKQEMRKSIIGNPEKKRIKW